MFLQGQMVETPNGVKHLIYKGYAYTKNNKLKNMGTRYACCSRLSKNCLAYVHVSKDNVIIKSNTKHNHKPPNYFFSKEAQFINLLNGTTLLMVNGYTFHKNAGVQYSGGIRWQCSSKSSQRCKAFVVLSHDEETLLRLREHHSHEPPKYKSTSTGMHVKIY
ncbi:hypothetical protein RR46_03808 [Papilio xuthus]|uniref:FLYWCH-type domain-containing protein n=1 Tax=Papilio xuthus TaxID=66420 RepID=A0A194Q280_PAPXU|nr:hypothetical protein RR46_03808 [Papilio xuthus]